MFRMSVSPTYWAPVVAELQGENGSRLTAKFECQFKRLDQDEVAAFAERSRDAMQDVIEAGSTASRSEVATTHLVEIVTDWKGILDDDNVPIPFNRDTLLQAVKLGLGGAIFQAFYQSLPKAKEKN